MLTEKGTVGHLKFADIENNTGHLAFGDLRLWRHVTKVPVMTRHAPFGGSLERAITMMTRIVNIAIQRWAALPSCSIFTVARRTIIIEKQQSQFCLLGELGDIDIAASL